MKTVKVTVSGRVTGVGFRYSAVRQARRYPGLRGWIRNRDADTVEAVVQGSEKDVEAFVGWLRQGPAGARVRSCQVGDLLEKRRLDPFDITY